MAVSCHLSRNFINISRCRARVTCHILETPFWCPPHSLASPRKYKLNILYRSHLSSGMHVQVINILVLPQADIWAKAMKSTATNFFDIVEMHVIENGWWTCQSICFRICPFSVREACVRNLSHLTKLSFPFHLFVFILHETQNLWKRKLLRVHNLARNLLPRQIWSVSKLGFATHVRPHYSVASTGPFAFTLSSRSSTFLLKSIPFSVVLIFTTLPWMHENGDF